MKSFSGIFFTLCIIIAIGTAFVGLRIAIQKAMSTTKTPQSSVTIDYKAQKYRMDSIRENQKRLMEDQRQRLKDMQRR